MSNFNYFDLMKEEIDPEDGRGTRDVYVRAPFGYPGAKHDSLSYLLTAIPKRRIDNEVCGGTGVWSLNRNHKSLELQVYNDRYSGVVAFYRTIRDPAKREQLKARLDLTVHSREEFLWCRDTWENCEDDVERSARWYYMLRMSFSQLGRNFARSVGGRSQFPAVIRNSFSLLDDVGPRLQKFQIENMDCIQCLRDYDGYDTVHYVDPDYIDTCPAVYNHRVDHLKLLRTIFELKGYVALSGYANELYDSPDWKWDDRISWKVTSTMKPQAFTENNNRKGMEVQMERGQVEEVLWIKH